jgi:hypothetical protein
LKIYIGLKEESKPAIFDSEKEPSKETHPKFDVIYGPFKNKEDAEQYVNALGRGVACGEG